MYYKYMKSETDIYCKMLREFFYFLRIKLACLKSGSSSPCNQKFMEQYQVEVSCVIEAVFKLLKYIKIEFYSYSI